MTDNPSIIIPIPSLWAELAAGFRRWRENRAALASLAFVDARCRDDIAATLRLREAEGANSTARTGVSPEAGRSIIVTKGELR